MWLSCTPKLRLQWKGNLLSEMQFYIYDRTIAQRDVPAKHGSWRIPQTREATLPGWKPALSGFNCIIVQAVTSELLKLQTHGGTTEEVNCSSYLLPLSHRETKTFWKTISWFIINKNIKSGNGIILEKGEGTTVDNDKVCTISNAYFANIATSIRFEGIIANSLWPSYAICQQRTALALAQVMTRCLKAPSHYLNQC